MKSVGCVRPAGSYSDYSVAFFVYSTVSGISPTPERRRYHPHPWYERLHPGSPHATLKARDSSFRGDTNRRTPEQRTDSDAQPLWSTGLRHGAFSGRSTCSLESHVRARAPPPPKQLLVLPPPTSAAKSYFTAHSTVTPSSLTILGAPRSYSSLEPQRMHAK